MKLLIDLQGAQTESRYRGIGRHSRALVSSLIEAAGAHDVSILLNSGLSEGFEELRYEFLAQFPNDKIKVFGVPGHVFEMDPANLWRMRAAELWRETFIAELSPDILYVSSLFEGVNDNAVTSIGLMDAPYATAVTLFDLIPLGDSDTYLGADFMRRFYYRRAQSLKRADHLIAISEFAKREAIELLQIPEERIDVALLAADPSFKRWNLSETEIIRLRAKYRLPDSFVFYVGAIEPRKNIPLIIEAFGKLSPSQRGDVSLVFGGRLSDNERSQLQMAAVRFGVDPNRLVLPGYIEEADLGPLYSISRLFVFPSMQEGFGLPPLEAMACGAPTLVARNSSLPEVVGREDQMFGTFDADELAKKMGRIFTDPEYADELRDWGVERAAQFSWDRAGRQTLESLEALHDREQSRKRTQILFGSKPKLAFVSPLPSDQTGIANYASELVRELGCFYEIECIVHGTSITDPWTVANFPLRNVEYFRNNADTYDYILYQMGNSAFHEHMLDLIASNPGVVVLHDFYLSGLYDWLGNTQRRPLEHFEQQLYLTHGTEALEYLVIEGRHAAAERYPANQLVFENAHGIIVHSQWAIDQAKAIYGEPIAEKMLLVPHLRAVTPLNEKLDARRVLGISADAFVVATFGFVADTKFGDRLVKAWAGSDVGRKDEAMLVFVGDHPPGPWGEEFEALVAGLSDDVSVTVTGYLDRARYELYLAAADVAVQLRRKSRGETSGAILDCMGAGLPVIVNAHGTSAEIGNDIAMVLPDVFTDAELRGAIETLYHDADYRRELGSAAKRRMLERHHPATVGATIRDAIERFSNLTTSGRHKQLINAIGDLYAPASPTDQDLVKLSGLIAGSRMRVGMKRIFFDITQLTEGDLHSGIERVVRAFLHEMMKAPPAGYRLEPVRIQDGKLLYARAFIARIFKIPTDILPDCPIDFQDGDIYFTFEWAAYILPTMVDYLQDFRSRGGRVVVGVHDLLPLQMPQFFPDHIPAAGQAWFEAVLSVADDLVCVSRCVADDVLAFGNALAKRRTKPIRVNHFRLAADITASLPTTGIPDDGVALIEKLETETTFLIVGTIEPRKGHAQILDAFHTLWKQGADVNLVIVGRKGWGVDTAIDLIAKSSQLNKRLHWVQGASDEYLEDLYRVSTALVAASEGEGYGLPLIEGAARGLPLIARDIPVFREVAGQNAFFFRAQSGAELADAIRQWMVANDAGDAIRPTSICDFGWDQAVSLFFDTLFDQNSHGLIRSK